MSSETFRGSRGQVDLVGHVRVPWTVGTGTKFDNVILRASSPEEEWLEVATTSIGPWRASMRSTYIRWALAINGLHVAEERHRAMPADKAFQVTSLRVVGGVLGPVQIALWTGNVAAKADLESVPMLVAWGVVDLYAVLDEFIFDIYRAFLTGHPDILCGGKEYRSLRKLQKEAASDPSKAAAWDVAWKRRLDEWQRGRGYAGLDKVFLAFLAHSALKAPSVYKHTTPQTWAESIRGIALLRNALVHGVTTVSSELAAFCKTPYCLNFDFIEGKPLVVRLDHLQAIECFCDQLLTGINLSLVELRRQNRSAGE